MLRHVERRQFEEIVNAVLEHHAVAPGLLGGVDQLPALVERHGCGNLDGHMLAVLHGVDGHRHMQLPRGADVHQVDVVALAELFPPLLAAVRSRCGEIVFRENLLRLLDPLGIEVAERLDFDPVDMGETLHRTGAAHAQSDESDPHDRNRVDSQPQHRMLALGTGRLVEYDYAVGHAVTLRRRAAASAEQHDGCPAQ